MKVKVDCLKNILGFEFYPEESEIEGKKVKLGNKRCEFYMPEDFDFNTLHKDVLALVILLLIYPFTNKTIELTFGVSQHFADVVRNVVKKEIFPIDKQLSKHVVKEPSKTILAYSGGVDSTAALTILPEDTPIYFIDRKIPQGVTSMYSKDAPYKACTTIREMGRVVYNIATDFEYVRDPVGFPVDVACAIPGLLLSEYAHVNSVALGMIMETAYRIGHENYENYPDRWHYKTWGSLFDAVGIALNLPVAGISEVGTQQIVRNSPYKDIAQSCMRAVGGIPCMKCMKCLRKRMLEKTLDKKEIPQDFLEVFFKNKIVQKLLLTSPMKHQDVLVYITSHYEGTYEPMIMLKHRMGGDIWNVDWVERWYGPSKILIPLRYQEVVVQNIHKYLDEMTIDDCSIVEKWDLNEFLESEEYINTGIAFQEMLTKL